MTSYGFEMLLWLDEICIRQSAFSDSLLAKRNELPAPVKIEKNWTKLWCLHAQFSFEREREVPSTQSPTRQVFSYLEKDIQHNIH